MAASGPKLVVSADDPSASSPFSPGQSESTVIEYSAEVMDHIRAETVSALQSIPYGGLEIAGVLFGKRTGSTVYISANRPIECEHASGPGFALSEKDAKQLERLLQESSSDPELSGFEVLGWYVSHTRRPFGLVPGDLEIFDRFFREPQKIIGIVQPAASGKARFGWFVRDDDALVDAQEPESEFTVYPIPGLASPNPANPVNGSDVAAPPPSGPIETESATLRGARREYLPISIRPGSHQPLRNPLALTSPGQRVRVGNRGLIAAGLITVLIAGAVLMFLRMRPVAVYPPPLHVLDTGTQLRIDWNPKLPVVQQARSAVLEIKDPSADLVRVGLSQAMLRSGSVFYDKPSSRVEVHLRLTDDKGSVAESMVYFIGREPEPKKPVDTLVAAPVIPAPVPVPTGVTPPEPDKGSADRARSLPVAARQFQPPAPSKFPPAPEPSLVEPPRIAIPQTQGGIASLRTEVPVSTPPPVVTAIPNTPVQPTSGRLIWTGELHKGSVLHITAQGPSTGSLNGKLPSRPIKVSMHSAELLEGVIAVYTADPNSTRTAEAPGRRNGWNVTMYRFDPKHAHDLSLVETPAEDNNFKLGIKSNNRQVSMIVIDWRATN